MNDREKNLGLVVLAVLLAAVIHFFGKQWDRGVNEAMDALTALEEQQRKAAALAGTGIAPAAAAVVPRLAMALMADLTGTEEADNIRVIGLDRSSEKTFRVTVEGRFQDVMRYLSFLERKDGKFNVAGGEMSRIVPAPGPEPSREIRAVLTLGLKG